MVRLLSVPGTRVAKMGAVPCSGVCKTLWLRSKPRRANLRRLKALYIDCGEKDQFNLLYGPRRFVRRLNELGIARTAVRWVWYALMLLNARPMKALSGVIEDFAPRIPHEKAPRSS